MRGLNQEQMGRLRSIVLNAAKEGYLNQYDGARSFLKKCENSSWIVVSKELFLAAQRKTGSHRPHNPEQDSEFLKDLVENGMELLPNDSSDKVCLVLWSLD